MNATKCDRCKRYFEEEIPRIGYQRRKDLEYYQLLDICPECLEEFFKFMGAEEKKHE